MLARVGDEITSTTRLFLVEDHVLFRDSLRLALMPHGFTVVGESASAREAYSLLETIQPDVLVVDLMLKDTDGISLLRELKRRRRTLPALVLARLSHPIFVKDAFASGALGYAVKDEPLAEIVEGLKRVSQGETYLSPLIRQAQENASGEAIPTEVSGIAQLSRREREVFCRLVEGMSSKDIAKCLCVSIKTVHTHRLQINRKLGVHSPTQLTRMAALEHLIAE
jgi:DNA-binding NarL/FixJ family response regulator